MDGVNFSRQCIWCDSSGRKYPFYAYLKYINKDKQIHCREIPVDDIITFEFYNGVDDIFTCDGFLIVNDTNGKISDAIGTENAELNVFFGLMEQQANCSIVIEKIPEDQKLVYTFFVDNISQSPTSGNQTKCLEIRFFGCPYYDLRGNPNIDTYGEEDGSKGIMSIVKEMITKSYNQAVDESFDDVKSTQKVQFVTSDNDNVFTAYSRLMKMQFSDESFEEALKFVYYDISYDKFFSFQVGKDSSEARGSFVVFMSQEGTLTEKIVHPSQIEIASPPSMSKKSFMDVFSEFNVSQYSLVSNAISSFKINPSKILGITNVGKGSRFNTDTQLLPSKTTKSISQWNSSMNVFQTLMNLFLNYDSILVNTSGMVKRPLMSAMTIVQDTTFKFASSDSTKSVQEAINKNRNILGSWYITKNHVIFQPKNGKFNQNLRLSRLHNNNE